MSFRVDTVACNETPKFIERSLQRAPDYVFSHQRSRLTGARWQHQACELSTHGMHDHVLVHHLSGSTRIMRMRSGRVTDSHSKLGSSTFVSCHHTTDWRIEGIAHVMHLYLPPKLFAEYAAEELGCADAPEIHEFFAADDSWLAGFFSMLRADVEESSSGAIHQDTVLLEQLELALCRRLIDRHALGGTLHQRVRLANHLQSQTKLSPNRLHRVVAFLEENYAKPLSLSDMSELTFMSRDHFVKAFRNTVGQTPYRYLLSLRLSRAQQLLRDHPESSVSDIAALTGFKSPGHFSTSFSKAFKRSPTQYRAGSG